MKRPSPWLFALTGTPYGVVGSFVAQVMPNLAQRAKIDLGDVGLFSALLFIPTIVLFLYAPLIDLGPRRKHWLLITSVVGAACMYATFLMPLPAHLTAFMVFAFFANAISGLVGSCNGALMSDSMPDELRGRAGGWYNVGNLSGGALSASLVIWLIGAGVRPAVVGAIVSAMMIAPSVAVLWLDEPPRPKIDRGAAFRTTLREARRLLFSKRGVTGIALCMSPVGTAALVNFFSGMSDAYGVSARTVAIVTGLGNAGLSAVGSAIVGYLCDRFNRRVLYLASGLLTAVCGVAMALSPRSPTTFVIGGLTYALITGFCYAAFTATVLETMGKAGQTAATQYSLFIAAGNLAITYVGLIDTRFSDRFGVEGVVASDAALNVLGVVVLGVAFWRLGSFGKWSHPANAPEPEPPPLVDQPPAPVFPTAVARIVDRDDGRDEP
ncbi:MAG TPA: MFS transporter [Kofleriaceae bacterium]|nr:MFS transporter [Kofleriaceae bacterium]